MPHPQLSERERRVLEAVIQSYVETAEPAGSRMISRRFGLGVSPATIRNALVNQSTTNRLTGIGTGSPNRLLYSLLQ